MALQYLGKDALPPLLMVLTNQHQAAGLRRLAAHSIKSLGTNAVSAVPVLVEFLNDEGHEWDDAIVLFSLKIESGLIVPALLNSLDHRKPGVRSLAVFLLGARGKEARSAVPTLLKMLDDQDWQIREDATNALRQIDPQALERVTR